jgi:hypothetical protein
MTTALAKPRLIGLALAATSVLAVSLAVSATSLASAPVAPVILVAAQPPSLHASRTQPVSFGACPGSMALVGSSCVDKWEASLVEVGDDGREAAFSPHQSPEGRRVRAVSTKGAVPQAHISMVEAQRACRASGKRLCKAAEWKTACKGPDATQYPYGNRRVASACVDTNRRSPMNVLHGGERSPRTMNDPLANQQRNTVETTGASTSCTNGFGVHDMVGNVHEWTDDGSFRGGYYLDTTVNGEGCDYRTTAHARSYHDYSTGFRCCADEGSLSAGGDES